MLVHEGLNCLFFESDNQLDLETKIAYLLDHPTKAEEFGKASQEIIKNEINENRVLNGYKEALTYLEQTK